MIRAEGDDLIVGIKEGGVAFEDLHDTIVLKNWYLPNNRIERFVFVVKECGDEMDVCQDIVWDEDDIASRVE